MAGFGKYLLKENWFNGISTVQTSASEEVLGTALSGGSSPLLYASVIAI